MVGISTDAPIVRLPERIDRHSRLGPFPSARDAARFLCYAAAGAILSPWVSPFLWLPIVAGGFIVSVWQPDGRPLDERIWEYLRWRLRSAVPLSVMTRRIGVRRGIVRVAPGHFLAVLQAGGIPIAYLPPADLEARFRQFRETLRGGSGAVGIWCTSVPIRPQPLRPTPSTPPDVQAAARGAYSELVELLCQRRRVRRVYIAVRATGPGPDGLARVDLEIRSLRDRLESLGVRSVRLVGRRLVEAAMQLNWGIAEDTR
jgi:hypothetical protein